MAEESEVQSPSGPLANPPGDALSSAASESVSHSSDHTNADEASRPDALRPDALRPDALRPDANTSEDAGPSAAESASDGTEGAEEAQAAEGGEAEAGPDGKRKRRRRKKRKPDGEAGEQSAGPGQAAEQGEFRTRRRDTSAAPFLRFFVGAHSARKHGFAVGEVVAGRVKEAANGVITVDLFGKGFAFADEFEPRELPPIPVEPVEPRPSPAVVTVSATAPDADAAVAEPGAAAAAQAGETLDASADAAVDASVDDSEGIEHEAALRAVDSDSDQGQESDDDAAQLTDADATLTGEPTPGARGPMHAAPVVPEGLPRPEPPVLGQVFRGRVSALSESGHIALVNRLIDRKAVLANVERYRVDRRRVEGMVFGFNRGGFDVIVEGARAFCPASAMSLDEIEDPTQYIGQKLEFLLPAAQSLSKDIIVSRRSILERQQRRQAREFLRGLQPGQKLKGRVTAVRDFGVFVDIGGVEGLVHQSELSFAHNVNPSDVCKQGDEVDVQVLRVGGGFEGGRRDRVERISLSIKALLPDPWDEHGDALKEGNACVGKVTRTTDFGAFVELVPQVEGLLHITELGRDLVHANQAVKEGDEICVVVERADKSTRRISLSKVTPQEIADYEASKAAGVEPLQSVKPGSRIKVKIVRVESRGLVVRVSGVLGKRARGYVPSSEMGERSGDLRKTYPVGTEIEVKIVGVERDGSLRCSPKALQVDEERRSVKDYRREAAKQGFGTFADLLRAKLGQSGPK